MRPTTLISIVLSLLLSIHGHRKKSLAPSGSIAALIVGFLMMSGGTRVFGVALIGFYLMGSRATKYGKTRKAKLEDGYHEAGYRTGWQVFCNSASALIAAFLWNTIFTPTSDHATIARVVGLNTVQLLHIQEAVAYDASWCALSTSAGSGWSRTLVLASLGHFACCLGDTLASELGILSRAPPRLITTLKPVPPGTNGAMSVGGTLASIAGGGFVGMLVGATLVLENPICAAGWAGVLGECVWWGLVGGGAGSLVDSLLGATVQQTRYSADKGVVLQDGNTSGKVISGWNVLSNNQVNLASSAFCAIMLGRA